MTASLLYRQSFGADSAHCCRLKSLMSLVISLQCSVLELMEG